MRTRKNPFARQEVPRGDRLQTAADVLKSCTAPAHCTVGYRKSQSHAASKQSCRCPWEVCQEGGGCSFRGRHQISSFLFIVGLLPPLSPLGLNTVHPANWMSGTKWTCPSTQDLQASLSQAKDAFFLYTMVLD